MTDIVEPPAATPFPADPTASWEYWTDLDSAERGIPDEWVWERLRARRDELLKASDHRMVSDAPWSQPEWAAYRQALRDLPGVVTNPRQAAWPTAPSP